MGYRNAGFAVLGVDLEPQPRYPFKGRFIQADAMKILETGRVTGDLTLEAFDAIHASPPCQAYSRAMKHFAKGYPELIAPVIAALKETGKPWVVENVIGADLPDNFQLPRDLPWEQETEMEEGLMLCGSMFGLRVQRHRLFQTSFPCQCPRYCDHSRRLAAFRDSPAEVMNPHNAGARRKWRGILGEGVPIERTWREEMGVGWMNSAEGRESIPPVYTEYIGRKLIDSLN